MKILLVTIAFLNFFTLTVFAADKQIDLKTPRGSLIKLDIYNPGLKSVLLLGPGQGCSARLDIYDAIGAEAKVNGFTVVRLYWAYCVANPDSGNPADDLSAEIEDFSSALKYVRQDLGFADANIFTGGKSLGTFVSFSIFQSEKSLQGLVLLTPVCTDPQTDPKNPKNVFAENYPGLSTEARPVLLVQGNADPLCSNQHFQDYLKDKGDNFIPLVVKGNHSLSINKPDGQFDAAYGAKNLAAISKWIFSWIGR